jgi:two-component system, OmpR family, catabolic regulation response regulator CreB
MKRQSYMNKKVKILIVEDESSIVDAVSFVLQRDGYEIVSVGTGQAALDTILQQRFDLILLDVGLPDINGFDVCKQIRKNNSVPIIFLTARSEEVDRVLGLELEADDYVCKPFSPRELVARIKAILRRSEDKIVTPETASKNTAFSIDNERLIVSFYGSPLDLVRYEYRILCILIRRPGRVYSREQLMNLAWESPEMSLERTIDTHVKTIRQKLREIRPQDDSILTHRGTGYSLREE